MRWEGERSTGVGRSGGWFSPLVTILLVLRYLRSYAYRSILSYTQFAYKIIHVHCGMICLCVFVGYRISAILESY